MWKLPNFRTSGARARSTRARPLVHNRARMKQPNGAEFQVRVPASTSNLGPGFDLLGLALSLHLTVRARVKPSGGAHSYGECTGTAAAGPRGPDDLVQRAFEFARERLGGARVALELALHSEIPVARGLGSSAAAIAAGFLLASRLAPRAATLDELIDWGNEMEGHPDNTTAALAGGCTLAAPRADGSVRFIHHPLAPELGFVVAWPRTPLTTHAARGVLPASVPFRDALENPRRLALLLEGLRRADPELLALGSEDRLHVPYRLPLIPGGAQALAAARAAGAWLATISGSGSCLIAIGPRGAREALAEALRGELARADGEAEARLVEPVLGVPEVRTL